MESAYQKAIRELQAVKICLCDFCVRLSNYQCYRTGSDHSTAGTTRRTVDHHVIEGAGRNRKRIPIHSARAAKDRKNNESLKYQVVYYADKPRADQPFCAAWQVPQMKLPEMSDIPGDIASLKLLLAAYGESKANRLLFPKKLPLQKGRSCSIITKNYPDSFWSG